MDNVKTFPGSKLPDAPEVTDADKLLTLAIGKLKDAAVVGITAEGHAWVASSIDSPAINVWLAEVFKKHVMDNS